MYENTMHPRDAIFGSLAECYVTVNDTRYNFMQLYEFESHAEVNIVDVPILGRVGKGHKPAGMNYTWSGTAHYNQSVMREIAHRYKSVGYMPYFDIQVTNEDPTSSIGRQTITHTGCLIEDFTLAKFNADDEILDEELSGTFEDWDMPEKFKLLPGMV